MPAIDIQNSCIEKEPWNLVDSSPTAVLENGLEIIGQKVVEFGRSGLNTWYGVPYTVVFENFVFLEKI